MGNNKTSYQTNFSGIKYSNNPLTTDINSFSNANNVYLNKYNALISRPPINAQEYPWQAYGNEALPIYLKLVAKYNLSNGGEVYVVLDTNATPNLYRLRHKSPAGVYSSIITSVTITDFTKFSLVQYKQYYIMFTTDGARVLDTTDPTNVWKALSEYVDIPITVIQTGNEKLMLPGNQLTNVYKKQFNLTPLSDDTIYALPENETAEISFPSQTDLTYSMSNANEYTRDRVLRKLNTPANYDAEAIISMVGETIAIAHKDRVDISLDYGDTFQTIVYPTTATDDYKNTASLSDDGQYFFYVHTNGVYRYAIGTEQWLLIEPVTNQVYNGFGYYGNVTIEREVSGLPIDSDMIGANYCHFVNSEKFAFTLAKRIDIGGTFQWILVLYAKGLNFSNIIKDDSIQTLHNDITVLSSYAYDYLGNPLLIIDNSITAWTARPYLNNRLVKVLSNDLVVCFNKATFTNTLKILALHTTKTHVYYHDGDIREEPINYVATKKLESSFGGVLDILEVLTVSSNTVKILMASAATKYWYTITFSLSVELNTATNPNTYDTTFQSSTGSNQLLHGTSTTLLHYLDNDKYIDGARLSLFDMNNGGTIDTYYNWPLGIIATDKVVKSGSNVLIYNSADMTWYTNIPILTTMIYTYLEETPFTQVPTAYFDDQNLWLGLGKTLWIGNLVDNKLSMPAINNNIFSKTITAIRPISATSKAIFFTDSITLCEQSQLSDGSAIWQYYPLKFSVGVRKGDSVITTNDGKLTVFPTKFGLAALTYQLDIAATEQAITYLSDDIKTMWSEFYKASSVINILHSNTQLVLSNGTSQVLLYDFRTNGWYPLNFPTLLKISRVQANADNYELLELQPADAEITSLTNLYELNKEADELYTYATPYKDLSTTVIPWHLTSQLLLLEAPNNYKNISQIMIDQIDSAELKQSAYFTAQIFRQRANTVKPSIELIYDIDTFAKIVKKVNWWKVLGFKWQLENDTTSSYPTQLRLYNISISYDISYEVK